MDNKKEILHCLRRESNAIYGIARTDEVIKHNIDRHNSIIEKIKELESEDKKMKKERIIKSIKRSAENIKYTIITNIAPALNLFKGYLVGYKNPKAGKMIINFNGINYIVKICYIAENYDDIDSAVKEYEYMFHQTGNSVELDRIAELINSLDTIIGQLKGYETASPNPKSGVMAFTKDGITYMISATLADGVKRGQTLEEAMEKYSYIFE